MASKTQITLGILTLIILASGVFYLNFGDDLRIRVDKDQTTFYTLNENNRFVVSGRESGALFEGSSKLYRLSSQIQVEQNIDEENKLVTIKRTTPYIRGPVMIDTYQFQGSIDDVTLFPVSHTVEIYNGTGLFYRYEVRDLVYDGPSRDVTENELSFGRNMKVEFQEENKRWAKLYKSGIVKVQYDILDDYEKYDVRLFDPPGEASPSADQFNVTFLVPEGGTDFVYSLNFNTNETQNTAQDGLTIPTGEFTDVITKEQTDRIFLSYPTTNVHNVTSINDSFINFTGSPDFAVVPEFNITATQDNDFTVSVWYLQSEWESIDVLVSQTDIAVDGWSIAQFGAANSLVFASYNNTTLTTLLATPNVSLNEWHHVAVTYNGSRVALYHNGTFVSEDNNSAIGIAESNFTLAKATTTATNYYEGALDELRVYEGELSPSDISAIYNSSRVHNKTVLANSNDDELALYLSFNENSGSTLYDGSDNEYDGQVFSGSIINDGILNNLSKSDFSYSGNIFKIVNERYSLDRLEVNYNVTSSSIDYTIGSRVAPTALSVIDVISNSYLARIVKGFFGNIPALPTVWERNYTVYFTLNDSSAGGKLVTVPINITDKLNALGNFTGKPFNNDSLTLTYGSIFGGINVYNETQEEVPFYIDS